MHGEISIRKRNTDINNQNFYFKELYLRKCLNADAEWEGQRKIQAVEVVGEEKM